MNESYLIKNYLAKLVKNNPSALGLNDDVFHDKKTKNVISVDTYVEKTHFPNFKNPDLLIKKIIRSSISDLICKGVIPKFYFISSSGNKKSFNNSNLKKIFNSLKIEQKKFGLKLSGGDTVFSKKNSFTIFTLGFSKRIIKRNKAKIKDDIYLTGELGDSYIGLKFLQKKKFFVNIHKKYFVNRFYMPVINFKFSKYLSKFANTSIDVSDGLLVDLKKMINKQNISSEIYFDKLPISAQLKNFLKKNHLDKKNFIFHGDDYQILFTAPKNKRIQINKIGIKTKTRITRVGQILIKKKFKLKLLNRNKTMKIPKIHGYEHFF